MKSVYIHIPFCHSICTYCDFCKLYYDKKLVKSYLEALDKEIRESYTGEPVRTIYIGGGTPSGLDVEELTLLFKILEIFNKSKLEEYTIECNVENTTKEKLFLFKQNGINRLSIGVQTFSNELLKVLGRNHTDKMIKDVIEYSKEAGIANINVDLIYGINGQTIDDLKYDIGMFLELDIPHVSLYSLIIEPHTKLYINSFEEIDEDLNDDMYNYINKALGDRNYHHYEISNYAKAGYESKHNLVYWHNEQYYGFGLGASSFIGNKRCDNTRSLNSYLDGLYTSAQNTLSNKEMMQNEMILGLRLTSGVNKELFYEKYGKRIGDVFPVDKLIDKQMLIDKDNFLYIPQDKLFISNSILIEFLD